MPHLRPCPQCSRHVRSDEARCPFCDSDCSVGASDQAPAAPSPSTRLGRAALMAFGTAVVAATTAASCGGTQGSDPQAGNATGGSTEQDGGSGEASAPLSPYPEDYRRRGGDDDPSNWAKPYGAPPADGLIEFV